MTRRLTYIYMRIVVNENILQLIAISRYPILSSAHTFNAGNTKKTYQLLNLAPQTYGYNIKSKNHTLRQITVNSISILGREQISWAWVGDLKSFGSR